MREDKSTSNVSRRARGRDVALGLAVDGVRVGVRLGRIGLLPLRVAARTPVAGIPLRRAAATLAGDGERARSQARRQLDATVDRAMASPEVADALDRVLGGPMVEAFARSFVAQRVAERVVAQVAVEARADTIAPAPDATPAALVPAPAREHDIERLARDILGSPALLRVTDEVLRSVEMQRLVEHVASSPELRRALARQGTTFAGEVSEGMRRRAEAMDGSVETAARGLLRRPPREESQ